MTRYIKKEDTKAGLIYDKKENRYIKDSEIVDILNNNEETIAELAWSENCEHSYIDAQGIGGGYVFKYCNKCGRTI